MELKTYRYQASKKLLGIVRSGHPWIYRGISSSAMDALPPSSLLRVVDGENHFVTYAIYEPVGIIAMRLLRTPDPFSLSHILGKLKSVVRKKSAFAKDGSAYRLLNGEGDFFPGLTCDIYSSVSVWQPYLQFWDKFLPAFAETVETLTGISSHICKLPGGRKGDLRVYPLIGSIPDEPLIFDEGGLKFSSFPVTGQKTGFFLDLRMIRELLPSMVKGKSVLNCFANSGAFSLIARHHGAKSVFSVDEDERCREQYLSTLTANRYSLGNDEWITADVWDFLSNATGSFDIVILDPPNICRRKSSLEPAMKGFRKLVNLALPLVSKKGGKLLIANCSGFMKRELCEKAFVEDGKRLKVLKHGSLPADHSTIKKFPEGKYLDWWLLGR